ncbi:MAG: c-type cytochrome [Pseudomonadota bacterium]
MKYLIAAMMALFVMGGAAQAELQLLNAKNDKPLALKYRKKQEITPAVSSFHETGVNAYAGDEAAIEEGAKTYKKRCAACHAADGAGKVGPALNDDEWDYARTNTEVGRFEIIYGGGKKSMRGFGRQLDQDVILKVMAFIDVLRAGDTGQTAALTKEDAPKAIPGQSAPPVPFTEAYMADDGNISGGETIWIDQCRHCHGAKAYPGKAPKLKPAKYKPEFVYRRVTDGFRKMPAWKDVFSDEERMQLTAYILSGSFSP